MKTTSSPVISIMIPVYNVEPFLCDCLDSVVNQTLREIEIICVNDCSTDGSLSILRHYADLDERFTVTSNDKNSGLSTTRNIGLSLASGEYLLFLDSDDFIDTDLCRKALLCAERSGADLVVYDFAPFRNQKELVANRNKTSKLATIDPLDKHSLLMTEAFAWTKLIRTEFAQSIGLRFPIVKLTYEDLPVHWQLITLAPKVAILPERLCFYRQRNTSMSYRTDWTLADRLAIYDSVRDFLLSHRIYEDYREVFLRSQLDLFCWLYENIDTPCKEQVVKLIKDRLDAEHWDYLNCSKTLSWKTRDFCRAIAGSHFAKARRGMWLFSRACYRTLRRFGWSSLFNSSSIQG